MKTALLPTFLLLLLASAFVAPPAHAEEAYAATTTADADVPVEWLELELTPKTMSELAVETAAWRDLLQAKVAQISAAEIAKKQVETAEKKAEADEKKAETAEAKAETAGEKAETAQEKAEAAEWKAEVAEEKAKAWEILTDLHVQRDGLIERLETVMTAFEKKGGDAAEYVAYVGAVSGTVLESVDVSTVDGIFAAVKTWLTSPTGGVHWLTRILLFFVVLALARIVSRIAGKIVGKAVSRWKHATELLKKFFVNTVRNLVFIIGLVVALALLGVNIGPLLAAIGAVGFIVGFALQGTLSNFASGLMILLYRPYDIGEVVNVAGVTGKVEQMSLVSTSILTPDNQTVIVPNNSIWGDVITNITGRDTRRVDLTFGIGYGDDMSEAQEILAKILADHPKILDEPEPVIKVHELADSSVNFIVRPWAKTSDYWDVYWDVTRAVKEKFDAAGISIPFPQQEVTMHQAT